MKIEIITTGDEVMQGVIVDTNTAWIAERCTRFSHEVVRHTSIGDYEGDIGDALLAASRRAGCVIVTGGLGPTTDDLTIEAAAKAFGVKLIWDESVIEDIRRRQALIPEGGKVLPNKVGTAPGVQVKFGDAEFFFLPGVPKELYQIFDDSVVPWLERYAKGVSRELVLRCFGVPEATIDEKLRGVDLAGCRLSFRVKFPEILLKLVMRGDRENDVQKSIDLASHRIREILGDVIYGEGETSLAQVVGRMLANRKMTIAVAESCTGGFVSSTITDVPGSSGYFERGVVSYSNSSKINMVGVPEGVIRAHGAVSRGTALAMAEGIRKLSGASIGLGLTGIAGPGGGTPEKPVGTVYIALVGEGWAESHGYCFNRDRLWFKKIVVATTLDLVRKKCLGTLVR